MPLAQGVQLSLQLLHLGARGGHLGCPGIVLRAAQPSVTIAQAGEHGLHAVVILLENGIELVIMAARAADGEAEHGLAHGTDYFIELILSGRAHGLLVAADLPGLQRGAGHQKPERGICAGDIAGQLIANEPVIGQVAVKRGNHPVAIMPGCGAFGVGLKADRFRPTNDIQPMLRPSLAVPRRGQQPVHHGCKCHWRRAFVRAEVFQFFDRGRQAGEIERHPP